MSESNKKVEAFRELLLEELELGADDSKNLIVRKRCIDDAIVMRKCDLSYSQFQGILARFKMEGFITDYKSVSVYNFDRGYLEHSNVTATDVYFPTKLSGTVNAGALRAFVTFDSKTRELLLDGKHFLAKPRFNSTSHQFIEYVFHNADRIIPTEELAKHVKPESGSYSGPNQIVKDLGFTGIFRKMFFVGATVRGVHFRKSITIRDFEALSISEEELETGIRNLRDIRGK